LHHLKLKLELQILIPVGGSNNGTEMTDTGQ